MANTNTRKHRYTPNNGASHLTTPLQEHIKSSTNRGAASSKASLLAYMRRLGYSQDEITNALSQMDAVNAAIAKERNTPAE